MTDGIARESWEISSRGEWLRRRQGLMTASRIAVIWNAHPYLTPEQAVAEMAGMNHGDNPAMRRGRILEPAVAAAVEEDQPGWRLRKATTFHTAPDHRLGCTPDYFADCGPDAVIDGLVNVQCKTVNPHEFERWRGTAPLGYLIQVATENLLVDAVTGWLAVMVTSPGYPLHLREVPRHAGAEAKILTDLAAWFVEYDAGRLATAAPSAEIAAAYDDGSHLDWSSDNEMPPLLAERAALKATAADTDKRLKVIDETIRARLGAARSAYCDGWLIKCPTILVRAYSVAEKTQRRLDIKPTKDEAAA